MSKKSKCQITIKVQNPKQFGIGILDLTRLPVEQVWHVALGFWICVIFLGFASYAFAQTGPISGGIVQCANDPCTLCDLFVLADRLTRFLLFNIMLPLAALIILIGGTLLLTARDNQQQQTQGKAVFTYAIYGMIIAFAAWLIISTLLATLGYKGVWYQFPDQSQCIAATPNTTGTNGGTNGSNEAYCIFNGQARCSNVGSCDVCTNEGAQGCVTSKPAECGGTADNENNPPPEFNVSCTINGVATPGFNTCQECLAAGGTCPAEPGTDNDNNSNTNGQTLYYCWRSSTGESQDNCNPSINCAPCEATGATCVPNERPPSCG